MLLGLSAQCSDFHTAEGAGIWTANIKQLDHVQSESSKKDQETGEPATFQTQINQHHLQQQGQGDAQLYNKWSPQTVCPWSKAQLEKRAPATTAVAERLGVQEDGL